MSNAPSSFRPLLNFYGLLSVMYVVSCIILEEVEDRMNGKQDHYCRQFHHFYVYMYYYLLFQTFKVYMIRPYLYATD